MTQCISKTVRIFVSGAFVFAMVLSVAATFAQEKQAAKEKVATPANPAAITATGQPLEKRLTGKYLGFEGNDRIGFEIGPGADNVFTIAVFEEGLPKYGHHEKEDDRYLGRAFLKSPDTLVIQLTHKFEGTKKERVDWALRSMTATVKTEGDKITLNIPGGKEWKSVDVVKIDSAFADAKPKDYPDEEFHFETALYGEFQGTEGQNPITVEIDNPKNGLFPVRFFEAKHHGTADLKKPETDVTYLGCGIYNDGKLQIVLTDKYDEITRKPVERKMQKLTATITKDGDKTVLSIPKNETWDDMQVSKGSQPFKMRVAKPIVEKK